MPSQSRKGSNSSNRIWPHCRLQAVFGFINITQLVACFLLNWLKKIKSSLCLLTLWKIDFLLKRRFSASASSQGLSLRSVRRTIDMSASLSVLNLPSLCTLAVLYLLLNFNVSRNVIGSLYSMSSFTQLLSFTAELSQSKWFSRLLAIAVTWQVTLTSQIVLFFRTFVWQVKFLFSHVP